MITQSDQKLWENLLQKPSSVSLDAVAERRMKIIEGWLQKTKQEQKNLLNIGSGQGYLEEVFRYTNEFRWTCFDVAYSGLLNIKRRYGNKLRYVKGSLLVLPFKKNSFDVVVCTEVVEHFDKENKDQIFENIGAILSPKSELIISVPVYEPISLNNHPVGHKRKYTPKIFLKELKDYGFEVVEYKYVYARKNFLLENPFNYYFMFRRPSVIIARCIR